MVGFIAAHNNIRNVIISSNFNWLPYFEENLFFICSIVTILILLTSTFISLLSFYPKIVSKDFEMPLTNNIYFFKSMANFNSSKELSDYLKRYYGSEQRHASDLCNQILNLSKIADKKYNLFKYSLLILLSLPIVIIMIIVFYSILRSL